MTQPEKRLEDLMVHYWRSQYEEWPLLAILAGEENDEPRLALESTSDYERRGRQAEEFLVELGAIEQALDASSEPASALQKTNMALLRHQLETARGEDEVGAHHYQTLFPSGPIVTATQLANLVALHDDQDAELYLERLRAVPRWLTDLEECLLTGQELGHRYPRLVLEKCAHNTRAALSEPVEKQVWLGPIERARSAQSRLAERWGQRALEAARDDVVPAFSRVCRLRRRSARGNGARRSRLPRYPSR